MFNAHDMTKAASKKSAQSESRRAAPQVLSLPNGRRDFEGLIMAFVQANVTAMRISSEADAVEARYDGLRELLTQQLQSLPPGTAALAGEPLKIDGHDRDELTWFCSAGPGLLTRYATGDFRVSLRLRARDAKSRQLDLGLLRTPKEDTSVANEHETWVRLIDNVGTLQIRFFDSRLNTWVQRWQPSEPVNIKCNRFRLARSAARPICRQGHTNNSG